MTAIGEETLPPESPGAFACLIATYAATLGAVRQAASKRIPGTAMARKSGKTQSWVSNRMAGKVPMDPQDREVLATLLDIPIMTFIPNRPSPP